MEEELEPFVQHGTEEESIQVSADEVLNAIVKGRDIDIEYAIIDGSLDIRKIANQLEQDEKGKLLIKSKVAIRRSEIRGDAYFIFASFRDESFSSTSFSGNAYFSSASFSEYADFGSASFRNVDFSSANFRNAFFRDASFSEYASFSSASFSGSAYFISASFRGASFNSASFRDAFFRDASFRNVDFSSASFSEYADFGSASFSWEALFGGSRFDRDVNLEEAKFPENFPPDCFAAIGWAYRKSLLFGAGYFFQKAGLAYLNKLDYPQASENFRNAKVEYEKEGQYDEAGEMYVREKEATRRHLRAQKGNLIKRIWFWIWQRSSNYGESPLRFIGVIALIVCGFALMYMPIIPNLVSWWPSITFEKYPFHQWSDGIVDGFLFNVVAAIYFSAVTFATLGFGDITPVNIVGRLWAIAEVLLGYLMFGVLITLVARKMTRS